MAGIIPGTPGGIGIIFEACEVIALNVFNSLDAFIWPVKKLLNRFIDLFVRL